MASKPFWRRKGWRKLGTGIRRVYPWIREDGSTRPTPVGNYLFSLYASPTRHVVIAGCRQMTIPEYREHAWKLYGSPNFAEAKGAKDPARYIATMLILANFEERLAAHRAAQKRRKRRA